MSNSKSKRQTAAEQDIGATPIGGQIRELRKAKGLSTAALALAIGKSAGYVNNVEHERTEVTVTDLAKISGALDVHISWFFHAINIPSPEEAGFIVRHDNRRELQLAKAGIYEELLSPSLSADIQMVLSTFAPGAVTGETPTNMDAEMAGLVLSGAIDLQIDDKQFHLEKGDSFLVPRGSSRKCENRSSEESITLWVNTPTVY
jgi:transcriptional regulator with XRE-family HTH domain